ncbi:unnamed protein product [Mytilus edulis]|uniref:Uncharacterized protein n=1 Tax=Mytilus edulis TaxID=6550 RepID=A0A8S3RMH3_MYTED|nr:unnamed protein product [Mytilus edulis]
MHTYCRCVHIEAKSDFFKIQEVTVNPAILAELLHGPFISHMASNILNAKAPVSKRGNAYECVSSFGTKELKLSSGEVLQIPEVVRTACHSSIVDTYMSYCKETEFEPLSRATLFNILSECPASHRTNLKGLDNIAADGVCAMDTLLEIVANFQNCSVHQNTNFSDMKEKLISYKLYLKTDFKHHVQMKDQCSDHCIQFALSDPTEKKLAHISEEERTEFLVDIETAEGKVLDWKSHILRCVNQDRSRLETLQNLTEGDAMIVMDWAMKFLPLRHREKQSDFFGQKGFNWHVIVVIFKDNDTSTLKHRTYVHTIESAKQDWYSVTSVIEHTLKTIKDQMPNIKSVVLRSDNAGCYHCSNLWHSLHGISQRTAGNFKKDLVSNVLRRFSTKEIFEDICEDVIDDLELTEEEEDALDKKHIRVSISEKKWFHRNI